MTSPSCRRRRPDQANTLSFDSADSHVYQNTRCTPEALARLRQRGQPEPQAARLATVGGGDADRVVRAPLGRRPRDLGHPHRLAAVAEPAHDLARREHEPRHPRRARGVRVDRHRVERLAAARAVDLAQRGPAVREPGQDRPRARIGGAQRAPGRLQESDVAGRERLLGPVALQVRLVPQLPRADGACRELRVLAPQRAGRPVALDQRGQEARVVLGIARRRRDHARLGARPLRRREHHGQDMEAGLRRGQHRRVVDAEVDRPGALRLARAPVEGDAHAAGAARLDPRPLARVVGGRLDQRPVGRHAQPVARHGRARGGGGEQAEQGGEEEGAGHRGRQHGAATVGAHRD